MARLLTVDESIFDKVPTIKKMRDLYDNYEVDSYVKESVSSIEQVEENDFIREILNTPVMKAAMKFMQRKGQFLVHNHENQGSNDFVFRSKELYHQNIKIKWNF